MNYEIELKAHVYNRENVIKILNEIAEYGGHTEKKDTYYSFKADSTEAQPKLITTRLRNEKLDFNGQKSETNYFTYKRKTYRTNPDGTTIEVNEENEFTFTDIAPLQTFFMDLGGVISIEKSKSVDQWMINIDGEEAHIELCNVPPLGDFLEIEIIKTSNETSTVNLCKTTIQKIFDKCEIPVSDIENKCYKELLIEAGAGITKNYIK